MRGAFNTIVYSNLLPILLLLVFILIVALNPIFNKKQTKLFLIGSVVNVFMLIILSVDYLIYKGQFQNAWISRTITSFFNFAVGPIVPLLLYKIFVSAKSRFLFYIPFLLNIVLCLTSIFMGSVFHITTENTYGRGSLFLVPFSIMVLYVVILIVHPGYHYLKSKRSEQIYLIFVILMLVMCMILEIQIGFRFLTWVCSGLSFMLYYLLLNIIHSLIDPLTGAYNRIMYTKALERISGKKSCVVALIDINNFKTINDTMGHDAGDQYLIKFVSLLSSSMSSEMSIYRIGGDEFVLLAKKMNPANFESMILQTKQLINSNGMDFAYGIKEFCSGDSVQQLMLEVDKLMYDNKKQSKSENLRQPEKQTAQ